MRLFPFALTLLAPLSLYAQQSCDSDIAASTDTSAFVFANSGAAIFSAAGLEWQRCLAGQSFDDSGTPQEFSDDACAGTATKFTLDEAQAYADALSEWRLPEVSELRAIVEARCVRPAINLEVFPNDPASFVWSSSPYGGGPSAGGGAWGVFFLYSDDLVRGENQGSVRLVRNLP